MKEAQKFALGDYSLALLQGSELPSEQASLIANRLSQLTGLSSEYIKRSKLHVHYLRFIKELLKDSERTIGRFDSVTSGLIAMHVEAIQNMIQALEMVIGAFSATFNQYVREDLKWKKDDHYKILIDVSPWNWGKSTNQSLNVSDALRDAMTRNPNLAIFVASGIYDLATPYYATHYTFTHLGLDPSLLTNIHEHTYNSGHMMYISIPSLKEMKKDIKSFYEKALHKILQNESPKKPLDLDSQP